MVTLRERFEKKIELVPFCTCWLWTSNKNGGGYGLLSWSIQGNRGYRMAHRVSYELYKGTIPDGMDVLHKCDNPPCVNPEHLFLGTDWDNVHDSMTKGRCVRARGEASGNVKLKEAQVREILEGGSTTRLARKFGVALSTIKRIKNGRTWKHLR